MSKNEGYIDAEGEVRELDEQFFANAKRGWPAVSHEQKKGPNAIRVDPDVIAHFKKQGKGWQARMNAILRQVAGL